MPKCRVADCKVKYAVFNIPGKTDNFCCATHRENDMIDVIHKRCEFEGCNTLNPSFNFPDKTCGIYCSVHKKDKMVDLLHKKCLHEGCKKQPAFTFKGKKRPLYCAKHKQDNMINIISKTCQYEGCKTQSNYNFESEKIAIYCKKHKSDGMVDVKNPKCQHNGCITRPNFNFEDEKAPLYCAKHKKDKMIDIKNKHCQYKGCKIGPSYNLPGTINGLYCASHKKPNMVNVKDKSCLSEHCNIIPSNPKYKGYCVRCFMYTFPNEPVSRNYKVKEKHVYDFIKLHFNIESYDKQVSGGCSKRRPDILIECLTHSIIIEVDEDQHTDYLCENKRMMQLFEDLANRPSVFIRFNPDKYTKNGKVIKSCFKYHKTSGVPIINDEIEWNKRLELLKITIDNYITNIPEKEVTIKQLYYDQ